MRKAGLLGKKPLTATRKMLETAQKDTGTIKKAVLSYGSYNYTEYESRFYFRAMISANKEILEVDLFTRKDLAYGKKEPRFRIFLDREKNDFISWNTVEEKWSRAKIDMLETDDDRYSYSYRGRNHATKETLNTVNRYLHTGCVQDVETAVIDFQARIRGEELSRKHRLVTDSIDGYMNTVPDRLPADWMKFINDRALEHSIFYIRDMRTGYCTHCRLRVPVPTNVRHKMTGKCSQCGSSVTYRSWKKQKGVYYSTAVSLLQKCTDRDNYVYRQFRVDMHVKRDNKYVPEINTWEMYRRIFQIGHNSRIKAMGFEWGEFNYTGIDRWCHEGRCRRSWLNGDGGYGYARSVPYTGNMKKLLKGTCLQYVPAAEILKSMGSKRINVMVVFDDMQMGFPYEAFWKMGLRRFIHEWIGRDGVHGLTLIEWSKKGIRPWEYFGVAKEDMRQAVRLDATDQQMRIIQKASELFIRLTDEQVLWLDRYMGVHVLMNYFQIQTPHRIIRYLQENAGVEFNGGARNCTLVHFWTDYLDMVNQLGWDLHDRSVFFPQDIQRAHDETAAAFAILKDKADAEKMKAKDLIMNRNAKEIKKAFCYRNDEYMITVPGCFLDFKHEGNAQHNCVATYYDRAVKGECIILFIRRRKAPKESFCTVELQNDNGKFAIMQNMTAYNKDAPEDAKAFMQKAVKEAQKIADRMAAEEGKKLRMRVAG